MNVDQLTKDEKKLLRQALQRYAWQHEMIHEVYYDEVDRARALVKKLGLKREEE